MLLKNFRQQWIGRLLGWSNKETLITPRQLVSGEYIFFWIVLSVLDVRDTCGMSGTATQQMIEAIASKVRMVMMSLVIKMLTQESLKPVVLASKLNPLLSSQLKGLNLPSVSIRQSVHFYLGKFSIRVSTNVDCWIWWYLKNGGGVENLSGVDSTYVGGELDSSNSRSSTNAWVESSTHWCETFLFNLILCIIVCMICKELESVSSQVAVLTEEKVADQLGQELARARICLLHWFVCLFCWLQVCLFECLIICLLVCYYRSRFSAQC